ncbi:MAG: hypothetical protein AAGA77_19330 [Bacteroidota bacterium]
MENKESKRSWIAKCLLAFVITFALFYIKFPHYVNDPNNQVFFSNGDLLVTLYDMIYHVRYDDNGTFGGMNYPEGDYIFMTDANGSFATVMRWIDNHLFDIDSHLPGILMTLIFLLLGVCGMFIFMILRTSGITTSLSFILAPLITFLSPQMVRIACHLSLSFPFVIPMVMLWTLRKYKVPKIESWDFVFVFVTFFFFMNNAYIGFIICMFAGLIGFFLFIKDRKSGINRKASMIIMATPVLITILVYFLLKINDPYDDRLEEQWGFFHYHTKLSSLFYPKWSLAATWHSKYSVSDKRSIEWTNNLGLVPLVLILSYLIYAIVRKFKKTLAPLLPRTTMMWCFWWASFCMFLFAANTSIFPIKNLIESYMGPLLMFKSSGRFSWPLYFVVALFAAKVLQAWMLRIETKRTHASYLLLLPLILFYAYETNFYLDSRFTDRDRKNYLTSPQIDDVQRELDSLNINPDQYQAMFVLPLFQGWNEKFRAGVYNRSEMAALQVSSATGIPMINGRLSRNSTSRTLSSVQMSSHPIIKKEIIDRLPNEKPILLVQGRPIKDLLSFGDIHLKKLGREIYNREKYFVFEVDLQDIRDEHTKWVNEARDHFHKVAQNDSLKTKPIIHLPYDDKPTEGSLFGQGAYQLEVGQNKIVDFRKNFVEADTLRFFVWSEITNEKYGMPEFIITVKGENDFYYRKFLPSREHKNIYKNWIRSEHVFAVPKGKNWIEVITRANQHFWIDELTISRANDVSIREVEPGKLFLRDGFPVTLSD